MSNSVDFRHSARQSLARAKAELESSEGHRARYAALELREAMEALTYDRVLAFKDEIPPDEYQTWQPRKLISVLLDIDPTIGMTSTLSFGRQDDIGTPAPRERMKVLGTDHVLTLAALKEHYDALGSYLHMPSLSQLQSGEERDEAKLRERCETLIGLIELVLSSRVWNSTFGSFAQLDECMNSDCKKPVRKRIPSGKETIEVQCFECKAEYTVTSESDGRTFWKPKMIEAPCSKPGCAHEMRLWPHEVKAGTHWRCRACGTHNGVTLSVEEVKDD